MLREGMKKREGLIYVWQSENHGKFRKQKALSVDRFLFFPHVRLAVGTGKKEEIGKEAGHCSCKSPNSHVT